MSLYPDDPQIDPNFPSPSPDLVAAFSAYGKNIGGGEAQAMLDEVDGPMNFTQMVTLFATKMAGGSDDDDVILASFEAFEMEGKIDAEAFRHSLMTFGVKFSASEVDDAFAEMKIDEVSKLLLLGFYLSLNLSMTANQFKMATILILSFLFLSLTQYFQGMIDAAHLKGLMVSK